MSSAVVEGILRQSREVVERIRKVIKSVSCRRRRIQTRRKRRRRRWSQTRQAANWRVRDVRFRRSFRYMRSDCIKDKLVVIGWTCHLVSPSIRMLPYPTTEMPNKLIMFKMGFFHRLELRISGSTENCPRFTGLLSGRCCYRNKMND